MKRAALLNLFIVGVALSLTAVGCKRGPKPLTPIPGSEGPVGQGGPAPMIDDANKLSNGGINDSNLGSTAEGIPQPPRPGPDTIYDRGQFAAETVHFDFDSSVVKPNDVSKIQTVVDYLKGHPANSVLIEGHCDERGTEEYNRALGERRALSVRETMVRMGAGADHVYTKSLGEDDPVDPAHNETAWAKNRRGEFVLMSNP